MYINSATPAPITGSGRTDGQLGVALGRRTVSQNPAMVFVIGRMGEQHVRDIDIGKRNALDL
jgi:hypothetical protein